jgi:hypothetical protein
VAISLSRLPTPGRVHLDAEVVVLRMLRGDQRGGFAHAAADFEDAVRAAAEHGIEVERRRLVGKAPARHALFAKAPLRVGDAALAQDEAADVVGAVLFRGAHSAGFREVGAGVTAPVSAGAGSTSAEPASSLSSA